MNKTFNPTFLPIHTNVILYSILIIMISKMSIKLPEIDTNF